MLEPMQHELGIDPAVPVDRPANVFATPLGVDFSAELIAGLDAKLANAPPHALAQVEVFVASDRMRRRITALYSERQASFLPRLTPVGRIADRPELSDLPSALSPLGLRLTLVNLIGRLLDSAPDLAARSALYDLSDSLASLMAEMHEEGVTPADIAALKTDDMSQHWDRSLKFLQIVARYFEDGAGALPAEARQAMAVDRLIARWQRDPPKTPIIVAGSTGSRGATARLMAAVARLPTGLVVLPGLDTDMPKDVWQRLREERRSAGLGGEDHPQYRLGRFAEAMGIEPNNLARWTDAKPHAPGRNAWMSLALRPAPVTDTWRRETTTLAKAAPPQTAFASVTLLEAPSPRAEATAIALRLREAAEAGQRATLVTPDRTLARAVTAALDRWGLMPDDSAGLPLEMTASGRLLALVADLMAGRGDAVELFAILKHPLTMCWPERDRHTRLVEALELKMRAEAVLRPGPKMVRDWAAEHHRDGAEDWAEWVIDTAMGARAAEASMADHVAAHIARTEALAAGSLGTGSGALWEGETGLAALERVREVIAEAELGGAMSARDYRDLITAILADAELRNPVRPHAGVMIWGALEARVQGADLMILGGLNEGTWPAEDAADPWLNRALREAAGLRLPDRRTGLSAHDFQQAAAAREVWLTRALRDVETETVPSRWLNRLTNLLSGSGKASQKALRAMRARGAAYLVRAAALEIAQPVAREGRHAPAPPTQARPLRLSVTEIEKLIRDPFAIYASKVLGLRPLQPLRPQPDARMRGTLIHAILHRFIKKVPGTLPDDAAEELVRVAAEELDRADEWPVARALWLAKIRSAAPTFIDGEMQRRQVAKPWLFEVRGEAVFESLGVTLHGRADRIDRLPDGRLAIYDYKSGSVPTTKQEKAFALQLRLEAAMAMRGAYTDGDPAHAAQVAYIAIDSDKKSWTEPLSPSEIEADAERLMTLWAAYLDPFQGFIPSRAMQNVSYASDYAHLSRFGEWDESGPLVTKQVGL
ncbi:MAG: double-strand break repair protein AddB [Pseudomonadota bacterium]